MIQKKSWTKRSFENAQSFQETAKSKKLNLFSEDGKNELERTKKVFGDVGVKIRNEVKEEKNKNLQEYYKIRYPLTHKNRELGLQEQRLAQSVLGRDLMKNEFKNTIRDAIRNEQYDMLSVFENKFSGVDIKDIKDQKHLDFVYEIREQLDEAFAKTDKREREEYDKQLDRELREIDIHLNTINFGVIKNVSDWKNANSFGQLK